MAFRRLFFLVVLLGLGWSAALAFDLSPWLRGGYGWRWVYQSPAAPERLAFFATLLAFYVFGGIFLLHRQRAIAVLIWSFGGTVTLTLAAVYVVTPQVRYELYTRTLSGGTTGWHYAAADIDEAGGLRKALSDWANFMAGYESESSHITTSPPGMPLLYYGINQFFAQNNTLADRLGRPLRAEQCHNDRVVGYSNLHEGYTNAELASVWLGILMPVWSAFTVIPLVALGRRLYDEGTARWSVLWWPLVPSALIFTPNPNTLYALAALVVVFYLIIGLENRSPRYIVLAGICMSVATFLHFTTLPVIFLVGLFTFIYSWNRSRSQPETSTWRALNLAVRAGLQFSLGLVSCWLLYFLISGVPVWEILGQSFNAHLSLERSYLPWLVLSLNDFFMFTGWVFICLAVLEVWKAVRVFRKREPLKSSAILAVSVMTTLLLMDFSGTTQGEAGRIWLFLSPFFLLMAAATVVSHANKKSGLLLTVTQGVALVVMVGFLAVIGSGLSKPPEHAPKLTTFPDAPYFKSQALFGDTVKLLSYAGQIEMSPDESGIEQPTLRIWLRWQSEGQLERPYYLSFLPVAPDGMLEPPTLKQPFEARYPVTCWLPSSGVIEEMVEIPLTTLKNGDWWVSLSMIDGKSGVTLPVLQQNGQHDQQVGIGPFRAIAP